MHGMWLVSLIWLSFEFLLDVIHVGLPSCFLSSQVVRRCSVAVFGNSNGIFPRLAILDLTKAFLLSISFCIRLFFSWLTLQHQDYPSPKQLPNSSLNPLFLYSSSLCLQLFPHFHSSHAKPRRLNTVKCPTCSHGVQECMYFSKTPTCERQRTRMLAAWAECTADLRKCHW